MIFLLTRMEHCHEPCHVVVLPLLLVHGYGEVRLLDGDIELLGLPEPPLLLELLSLGHVHGANLGTKTDNRLIEQSNDRILFTSSLSMYRWASWCASSHIPALLYISMARLAMLP